MEILIQTLRPVTSYVPDTGVDASGNTYLEYALTDAASFSFTLPNTYVAGEDMTLVLSESSASSSKAHKWSVAVTVATSYTATYTGAYTCSVTGGTVTTRSITVSTAGAVGGHALAAGMLVSMLITRVAADSNEDSAAIRVYTVSVTTTTTSYPATTCSGRAGAIVTSVLSIFNDYSQKFITQADIISWINECQQLIAEENYWTKHTLVTTVTATASYNLDTLISDLVNVLGVRYAGTARSPGDTAAMKHISSWQVYLDLSERAATTVPPTGFYLENNMLYLVPTPSVGVSSGLQVYHSYYPSAIACTSNYTPWTPKSSDGVYVNYALCQAFGRDRHAPEAMTQSKKYYDLYQQELSKLIATRR